MSTPPPVGKPISVKVDAQLYYDLQTMLSTGMTITDAVRSAMRIVAGTYRKVWDHTDVPSGVRPTIERFWITRYDPGDEPERGTSQSTVPTAYWLRATPERTETAPRPTEAPAPAAAVRPEGPWPDSQ
ncbi:hypothetical protein [Streptomyces cylindrosporus]|uniref:Uncharacterized protein n=1 Tax=Streptomyces cylindrosporus TaxID=2927583 RepID=A0ABS9Y2H3_9ACTN|nr:hypothetical protein [Streptomyces cylindrosporus]MCI3271412.1 hypothetical protein [Streptomyces cylindrosporus]